MWGWVCVCGGGGLVGLMGVGVRVGLCVGFVLESMCALQHSYPIYCDTHQYTPIVIHINIHLSTHTPTHTHTC